MYRRLFSRENWKLIFATKTHGTKIFPQSQKVSRLCGMTQFLDFMLGLTKTDQTGCKEKHFYSLPFGQAEASIYQPRRHFNQPQKRFVLLLFKLLIKHHLPIGQNRIHKPDSKIHQPRAIGHYFLCTLSKLFKDCLIVSARQALDTEGRFTTKGLELKHKLQKKKIKEEDIPKEVSAVTKVLNAWVNEYHIEEERALRGLGKFRLASGYERFLVDPVRWNRWGPERQKQHIKAFRAFTPLSSDKCKKPTSVGLKCTPTHKRRRTVLPEPQLFTNQAEPSTSQLSSDQAEPPSKKVSPLRLQKPTGQSLWQVHCYILNLHSQVLLFNYPNLHFISLNFTRLLQVVITPSVTSESTSR